jgi:hypothetical protein
MYTEEVFTTVPIFPKVLPLLVERVLWGGLNPDYALE